VVNEAGARPRQLRYWLHFHCQILAGSPLQRWWHRHVGHRKRCRGRPTEAVSTWRPAWEARRGRLRRSTNGGYAVPPCASRDRCSFCSEGITNVKGDIGRWAENCSGFILTMRTCAEWVDLNTLDLTYIADCYWYLGERSQSSPSKQTPNSFWKPKHKLFTILGQSPNERLSFICSLYFRFRIVVTKQIGNPWRCLECDIREVTPFDDLLALIVSIIVFLIAQNMDVPNRTECSSRSEITPLDLNILTH
jgi:hypothetical protein